MSFYRTFIAAVAAMGLATSVFADDAATTTQPTTDNSQAVQTQTADASSAVQATGSANQATDQQAQAGATDQSKVNLNTASAKDLMKVKGLSASKAKAIVSYRKKHGEFKSLDDLKSVSGFKKVNDKTMQQIQSQLTIG